ncbi:hypothetical protein P3X46_005726 [Hevea brasiliensis]|uniref:Phosphofructokinase domain-containing protein n=1 Tax=Hevea brasiliensis TaxID=3981 RepID=A0ABQ9N0V4_HEVBR|nr:hypothetical protein P3X46_005726 [Hevea brasiliensis]
MAVSLPEATYPAVTRNSEETLSSRPFNLQKLPHLTDYLPDLKSYTNPLDNNPFYHPTDGFYLTQSDVILRQIIIDLSAGTFSSAASKLAYHQAGPRKQIFFDPSSTRAAIVTCGGLCPGMNTVIRELVVGLWELYGVRQIYGVVSGYRGFYSREPIELNTKLVHNWHKKGGTVLQTSRGGFDLNKIVDAIQSRGFNQVYIIGGDGTMRGAVKIFDEIRRRKLNIGVAGIPKTVDNDTAVEMAQQAINAAHVEPESAVNGKGGLFEFLGKRLKENGHAVLVVAEGAGQDMIPRTDAQKEERDESGNPIFLDVDAWLKSELKKWWSRDHPNDVFTVKHIDPTCMIRAIPANNLYCALLAHSAIHGIMAGYTGFVCGPINGNYAYILLKEVAEAKNEVNLKDHKWAWVRSVTNQPGFVWK